MQQMFDSIRMNCPGVTDEQMQLEFVQAAFEFFNESTAWRESGTVTVEAPYQTIGLSGWRTGADVIFPWLVKWNGQSLTPVPVIPDIALAQIDVPRIYSYDLTKTITLAPQPNTVPGTVHIFVALRPNLLAPVIPDAQLAAWFQGLLDTTMGRLYARPAKPWSNMALAQTHLKLSRSWINKARDAANRGFGAATAPWRFPYFARGSGARLWGWGGGISTNG
jgi:hypothetical protein